MAQTDSIRRLPAVLAARGVGRSTHYADVAAGLFPPPVAIGKRAKGWPDSEIAAVNAARIAGKSTADIKRLVSRLVKKRAQAADGVLAA